MTIDPRTLEDVKGWLTTNAKDYWTAADLAKAAAKEFDLFIGSDWTSFERDIPDEVVSAAEIAWNEWNKDDDQMKKEQVTKEESSGLETHLAGKKDGFTSCGQHSDEDTLVQSVKDATCYYCKLAWGKQNEGIKMTKKIIKESSADLKEELLHDAWEMKTSFTHALNDFSAKAKSTSKHLVTLNDKLAAQNYAKEALDAADMVRKEFFPSMQLKNVSQQTEGRVIKEELSDRKINDFVNQLKELSQRMSDLSDDNITTIFWDTRETDAFYELQEVFDKTQTKITGFIGLINKIENEDLFGNPKIKTESEEHEYVRDPSLPDDFEECGYCGFDHEYEALEANQWHEENPGQGYDEGKDMKESAELFNIVVVNDKTKKKKYLTSSPLSHSEATTMLKKQSAPAKKELRIKLEPVTKDLAAKKPWLDPGSQNVKESEYKEEPNQMNSSKEVVDEAYETDEDAKTELALYMDNEYSIYNQKKSIIANLMRKMKSGKYDPTLAPKLWAYWVESGAKAYAKEYDSSTNWSKMFPKPLRDALAAELAKDEEEKIKNGEYGSDPSKL